MAPTPPTVSPGAGGPAVSIETDGGTQLNVLYDNQPFNVVVNVPRTATPPETITVHFQAPGGDRSLKLAWDQGVKGPVRYKSEPITIEAGARAEALPAYRTVRDHALEVNREFLDGMHDYVVRGLIAIKPFGDLPATVTARNGQLRLGKGSHSVMM